MSDDLNSHICYNCFEKECHVFSWFLLNYALRYCTIYMTWPMSWYLGHYNHMVLVNKKTNPKSMSLFTSILNTFITLIFRYC